MSLSSVSSTSNLMIKKSVTFYSSKIRPAAHLALSGRRTLYAHDPSDPAGSPGKTPSEFPNRGPGYQPAYPVEMPQLPDDLSDPPPTGPGPDFPVPPSTPPPKPDIPTPKPEWMPPPPGTPSPTPDPPAGPGVAF